MTRKKVSEIRGVKKRVFIEKPEKMLPECFRVAKERMVVQDSYLVLAKKQDPNRFSVRSLDLCPFPGLQILDALGNLAGMVKHTVQGAGRP